MFFAERIYFSILADYLADFPGKFFHITLFAIFQENNRKIQLSGAIKNQKNQTQGMPATGD